MRVGIDVMEPHPCAKLAHFPGEIGDVGPDGAILPRAFVMLAVHPIGRGVLADHEKLPHPRLDQLFRLAQDGVGRAADQTSAHVGDDAELALVIAAFGYLQIAVMAWGEADAGRGQQVDEGVGLGRHGGVDGVQHLFVLMRPRDGQHLGMRAGDVIGLRPQTAGDDDAAVLLQRLADGIQAFGAGAVEEAAGVDDHRIRARVIGRDRIALGAQAGQDALAVHQRLGTAERDHADRRLACAPVIRDAGAGEVGAKDRRVLRHGGHIAHASCGGKRGDAKAASPFPLSRRRAFARLLGRRGVLCPPRATAVFRASPQRVFAKEPGRGLSLCAALG